MTEATINDGVIEIGLLERLRGIYARNDRV